MIIFLNVPSLARGRKFNLQRWYGLHLFVPFAPLRLREQVIDVLRACGTAATLCALFRRKKILVLRARGTAGLPFGAIAGAKYYV